MVPASRILDPEKTLRCLVNALLGQVTHHWAVYKQAASHPRDLLKGGKKLIAHME